MLQNNVDVTIACPGPVHSLITDRCVTGKVGEVSVISFQEVMLE